MKYTGEHHHSYPFSNLTRLVDALEAKGGTSHFVFFARVAESIELEQLKKVSEQFVSRFPYFAARREGQYWRIPERPIVPIVSHTQSVDDDAIVTYAETILASAPDCRKEAPLTIHMLSDGQHTILGISALHLLVDAPSTHFVLESLLLLLKDKPLNLNPVFISDFELSRRVLGSRRRVVASTALALRHALKEGGNRIADALPELVGTTQTPRLVFAKLDREVVEQMGVAAKRVGLTLSAWITAALAQGLATEIAESGALEISGSADLSRLVNEIAIGNHFDASVMGAARANESVEVIARRFMQTKISIPLMHGRLQLLRLVSPLLVRAQSQPGARSAYIVQIRQFADSLGVTGLYTFLLPNIARGGANIVWLRSRSDGSVSLTVTLRGDEQVKKRALAMAEAMIQACKKSIV